MATLMPCSGNDAQHRSSCAALTRTWNCTTFSVRHRNERGKESATRHTCTLIPPMYMPDKRLLDMQLKAKPELRETKNTQVVVNTTVINAVRSVRKGRLELQLRQDGIYSARSMSASAMSPAMEMRCQRSSRTIQQSYASCLTILVMAHFFFNFLDSFEIYTHRLQMHDF